MPTVTVTLSDDTNPNVASAQAIVTIDGETREFICAKSGEWFETDDDGHQLLTINLPMKTRLDAVLIAAYSFYEEL